MGERDYRNNDVREHDLASIILEMRARTPVDRHQEEEEKVVMVHDEPRGAETWTNAGMMSSTPQNPRRWERGHGKLAPSLSGTPDNSRAWSPTAPMQRGRSQPSSPAGGLQGRRSGYNDSVEDSGRRGPGGSLNGGGSGGYNPLRSAGASLSSPGSSGGFRSSNAVSPVNTPPTRFSAWEPMAASAPVARAWPPPAQSAGAPPQQAASSSNASDRLFQMSSAGRLRQARLASSADPRTSGRPSSVTTQSPLRRVAVPARSGSAFM